MHTRWSSIYLSPHLDDAVLSCGGQIAARTVAGRPVLIVTVMAGDPPGSMVSDYAQGLHNRWQVGAAAVAQRRSEDLAACALLGAQARHWSVPDCIYRHHPERDEPFYRSDDDIFGAIHSAEQALVDDVAAQIRGLPAHDRLLVPLAVGHHVDHQLVRAAAERAFGVQTLAYYEDYPYVQESGSLERLFQAGTSRWHPEVISLSPEALEAKIIAIATYRSQVSTFFKDEDDLGRQVRGYAVQVGGERIWRLRHP